MSKLTQKQQEYLKLGEHYERLFIRATGAEPRRSKGEDFQHIDCRLNGVTIDVKGWRSCQQRGYVLIEFKNVAGRDGWCSSKSAQKIAFYFPEGFYVVETLELKRLAERKCLANPMNVGGKVIRQSNLAPETGLYLIAGREGRKDVFTYITKDDLLSLPYEFYKNV